jgi:elongation factor 1-beta
MATAVTVKLFPEDMAQFESIKQAISGLGFRVANVTEEPIAFGMKALRIVFVVQDSEGSNAIEDKVRAIPGVSEVQIEGMSLI